jgi:two-component system, NtrC family, sensor histidine kinase PilS
LPNDALAVLFDAEHLRRVLVNLLDNARRYASTAPGAIALTASATSAEQARLSVASDGEPIAADIEPFLFEPFFSTRSRGTGLGLYICRELCERYGGSIDYWQHPPEARHHNEFVVTLRVATADAAAPNQDRLLP